MTIEGVQNYLGARLPFVLNARQHFRLLRTVFVLVFVTTAAIHLLAEQEKQYLTMLMHAVTIGLVYVFAVGLATAFLYAIRGSTREVRVWHLWIASLASFLLGYYFLPIDGLIIWLLGVVTDNHAGKMKISQLLPVWFLLTYIFVQPYLNEGLILELIRLRDINALLQQHQSAASPVGSSPIHFESGRTDFTLNSDLIRNIVVEDHYCYVHYLHKGGYAKRNLAMPLRDVQALLPDGFLHVHRSHIVNLKHIASISRKSRKIRVVLEGGFEVPVSRHRLDEVLPLIRKTTESR